MWFNRRDGGMGREAINVVASAPNGIAAESPIDTTELRCGECGYGIVVSGEPPVCPMCRSSAWQVPDLALTSLPSGRPG